MDTLAVLDIVGSRDVNQITELDGTVSSGDCKLSDYPIYVPSSTYLCSWQPCPPLCRLDSSK